MIEPLHTHFEIFAWDDQFLVCDILPVICDCMDVLRLFQIIIDEINTSRCFPTMIFGMIIFDEKVHSFEHGRGLV